MVNKINKQTPNWLSSIIIKSAFLFKFRGNASLSLSTSSTPQSFLSLSLSISFEFSHRSIEEASRPFLFSVERFNNRFSLSCVIGEWISSDFRVLTELIGISLSFNLTWFSEKPFVKIEFRFLTCFVRISKFSKAWIRIWSTFDFLNSSKFDSDWVLRICNQSWCLYSIDASNFVEGSKSFRLSWSDRFNLNFRCNHLADKPEDGAQ